MNDYIDMPEIVQRLRYEHSKNPERSCREWLSKHGIKQFRRGGIYVREQVLNAIELEKGKCLLREKSASSIMSGERFVWEKTPLKSPNVARDLLKQKMQQAMFQS